MRTAQNDAFRELRLNQGKVAGNILTYDATFKKVALVGFNSCGCDHVSAGCPSTFFNSGKDVTRAKSKELCICPKQIRTGNRAIPDN